MNTGSKSKLIKTFEVTPANVHDSQVLAQICDANEPIFDDSAYYNQPVPENCAHHTVRRAFRNSQLTEVDKKVNRKISKIRCRVEHVFGFIKNSMKGSLVRGIGSARANTNVMLANLVYNFCQYEQIRRLKLNSWVKTV
ncbi:IS5 family transposase [Streptococcus rupicaprae]|uniref:IS5 family transposase n=1 Tax=Streptococcus rupicaprae TaxID=759619 RepID=A0ABV2FJI6_9STRE